MEARKGVLLSVMGVVLMVAILWARLHFEGILVVLIRRREDIDFKPGA
jgi:hypothetical protein